MSTTIAALAAITGSSTRKQVSRSPAAGVMGPNGQPVDCCSCHRPIRERFLLRALDQYWHEDCLKCSCCDCRLGEVGSTLFAKANLILCKRDYLRLFGNTGYCSACNKTIPGFEMVMRARSNVYHLECFSCFQCHQKFCVGDRFYLHENKILCEYDYEERMVFANLSQNIQNHASSQLPPALQSMAIEQHSNSLLSSSNGIPMAQHNNANLALNSLQRLGDGKEVSANELCDAASSGYGSGDSPFDHS